MCGRIEDLSCPQYGDPDLCVASELYPGCAWDETTQTCRAKQTCSAPADGVDLSTESSCEATGCAWVDDGSGVGDFHCAQPQCVELSGQGACSSANGCRWDGDASACEYRNPLEKRRQILAQLQASCPLELDNCLVGTPCTTDEDCHATAGSRCVSDPHGTGGYCLRVDPILCADALDSLLLTGTVADTYHMHAIPMQEIIHDLLSSWMSYDC